MNVGRRKQFWAGLHKFNFHFSIVEKLYNSFEDEIFQISDPNGFYLLHWATILGNANLVEYILQKGVSVNQPMRNRDRTLPLHLAALEGQIVVINTLLQYGADVNCLDNKGCTPLMRATMFGRNEHTRSVETVLHLLLRGADPNRFDNTGFSAMHYAVLMGNEEVLHLMITIGIPVTLQQSPGPKPLQVAVYTGDRRMLKILAPVVMKLNFDEDAETFIKRNTRLNTKEKIRLVMNWIAKVFVVFFASITLLWQYPQYILYYLPATRDLMPLQVIMFIISSGVWFFWIMAALSNPGHIPKDQPEYFRILRYRLKLQKLQQQKQQQMTTDDEQRPAFIDRFANARMCHICKCLQPPYSKHCRQCDRCVRGFDHHCVYIHNCIGAGNRTVFVLLLVSLVLTGLLYMLVILLTLHAQNWTLTALHTANLLYSAKLISIGAILMVCKAQKWPTSTQGSCAEVCCRTDQWLARKLNGKKRHSLESI